MRKMCATEALLHPSHLSWRAAGLPSRAKMMAIQYDKTAPAQRTLTSRAGVDRRAWGS